MTLKEQLSSDLVSVFYNTDEFADDVTYTPKATGVGAAIKAIFDFGQDLGGAEYGLSAAANVRVQAADVAAPQIYDTIVRSGVTWTVRIILSSDGYEHIVRCDSDPRQIPEGIA